MTVRELPLTASETLLSCMSEVEGAPLAILAVPSGTFAGVRPFRFDSKPAVRKSAIRLRMAILDDVLVPSRARVYLVTLQEQAMRIGSSERLNDLVFPKESVSYRHAKLGFGKRHCRIVDLESAGGTYVEGNRLPVGIPCPVVEGQVIRFGEFEVILLSSARLLQLVASPNLAARLRANWELPTTGIDLRRFVPRLATMSVGEFLKTTPPSFLLQIPRRHAPTEAQRGDMTIQLASKILTTLERERGHLDARVHSLIKSRGSNMVGREADPCQVVLGRPSVSKRHAILRPNTRRGFWTVVDLESRNGTYLGKSRLPAGVSTPIRPGDTVSFGDYSAICLRPKQLHQLASTLAA